MFYRNENTSILRRYLPNFMMHFYEITFWKDKLAITWFNSQYDKLIYLVFFTFKVNTDLSVISNLNMKQK